MIDSEKLEELLGVPVTDIETRLRLKRIWFEHVKRRPSIDYLMAPERAAAFNRWRSQLPPHDDRRRMPMHLLKPPTSPEEQKIIDTPIETLMENYKKSLSPSSNL